MPFSEQLIPLAKVFSVFLSTGLVTLLILLLAACWLEVCVILLTLLVCMELLEILGKRVLPLLHTFTETVFSFANALMMEVGGGFPLEGGGFPLEDGETK